MWTIDIDKFYLFLRPERSVASEVVKIFQSRKKTLDIEKVLMTSVIPIRA
jgi:hypothetical protein